MRKLIGFLLVLFVVLSLSACAEDTAMTAPDMEQSTSTSDATTILTTTATEKPTSATTTKTTTKVSTTATTTTTTTTFKTTISSKSTTDTHAQESSSRTVYITKTGKKYHCTKECPGLTNAKEIFDTTLAEALNKNLGPCSKCY
ncbi:MAG: hypothetical protein IIW40_01655 [Clostridia bacterium]|nr:hypothetical protein [Clostridia bacterium]